MNAANKAAWVLILWLLGITGWMIVLSITLLTPPAPKHPKVSIRWEGDGLRISGSGYWLVTHLEHRGNGTFARLPEPQPIVESGGVWISPLNLANFNWLKPANLRHDAQTAPSEAPPKPNAEIRALYVPLNMSAFDH